MCKIHRIHYSINKLKNSVNKITECIVIFKKIGKCNCMRFFFLSGIYIYISAVIQFTFVKEKDSISAAFVLILFIIHLFNNVF